MNLLCVKFRSTWTPREAAMFHHQSPWSTPWCPWSSLLSKDTHTHTHTHTVSSLWQSVISSSEWCTGRHHPSHSPICNIMNPPSCHRLDFSLLLLHSRVCYLTSERSTWVSIGRGQYISALSLHNQTDTDAQGQQCFIPAGLESQVQDSFQQSRLKTLSWK